MEERRTNLYRLRKACGYTQKQLADISGIDQTTISRMESGVRDINKTEVYTVYLMAQALGCPIEDLLEFERDDEE